MPLFVAVRLFNMSATSIHFEIYQSGPILEAAQCTITTASTQMGTYMHTAEFNLMLCGHWNECSAFANIKTVLEVKGVCKIFFLILFKRE